MSIHASSAKSTQQAPQARQDFFYLLLRLHEWL
jgi:hypothetical protein